MTSPTLISVCIVTYNHRSYIADCLNSVLAQYGDFRLEVLIGDDQSTDNTIEVIEKILNQYRGETKIHVFHHEKNLGPSKNYQFLIARATGDFIAHLDGDDFWLPGKLQGQMQFLQKNPDCPACYTNAVVIKDDKSYWGFFSKAQPEFISNEALLIAGNFLNHSSLIYKSNYKSILLHFPENFIDYRIHLILSKQGDLGFINKTLTAYRVNSATSQLKTMRTQVLFLYVESILAMKPYISDQLFKKSLLNFLRNFSTSIMINHNIETYKKLLKKIKKHYYFNNIKIIIDILPHSLWMECKSFFYSKIYGKELRFLQRNGINQGTLR